MPAMSVTNNLSQTKERTHSHAFRTGETELSNCHVIPQYALYRGPFRIWSPVCRQGNPARPISQAHAEASFLSSEGAGTPRAVVEILRFGYWPSKRLKTNPGCWLEVAQGWAMSENKDLMAIVVVGCGVIVSLLTPAHRSLANKRKYETC